MSILRESSREKARVRQAIVASDEGICAAVTWWDGREVTGTIETVVEEQGIFWFTDSQLGQRSIMYVEEIAYWRELPS